MTYDKAMEAADFIRGKSSGDEARVAVVLGSGLGAFAEDVEGRSVIGYADIPHFSRSTVEGHKGQLVLGGVEGVGVAVQQGRFHYYEGYSMDEVMLPMRTFRQMGVETVILTNAAGSLNAEMKPGSLMLVSDHINLMGVNPLRGANDDRLGPRFPDLTNVYDAELQEVVVEEAQGIESGGDFAGSFLHRGVYCALSGPTYETPAEIRLLRLLGADAVGMSTVPEAIAARHTGMRVIGISCITNFAAGMTEEAIVHDDVMATGERVGEVFKQLLRNVIRRLG